MKELKLAVKAAKKAGKLLRKRVKEDFQVFKKSKIDLVTEVDQECQNLIVSMIQKKFPNDIIIGEEGDQSKEKKGFRRWIIDPIDGTTNFAHGYPCYCISIGFEKNGELEAGVIYDPTRKELFSAQRTKGAHLNDKKIKVTKETDLISALLVTGFPYDLSDPETNNLDYFNHMMMQCQAVRRDGSAALNLAYVAAGRFDGFWETGLKVWDLAAGVLLVKEAGGVILPMNENKHFGYSNDFVCGNEGLSNRILDELKRARKTPPVRLAKQD